MKQLLQSVQEEHIIVALHNQAFVFAVDPGTVTRLATPEDASEIQAVALTKDNDRMVYAVARANKSLQVFCETELVASYVTAKRTSSLCFASVHDTNISKNTMTVVVTGDLAGDAVAYSIGQNLTDNENEKKKTKCRLLLGHTASMLTKIKVHHHWILTADRDEKIRVSYFPDTHRIHGYLLGHLAFVSSFDVFENVCASCGGDRMIRVWNLLTCTEVASVSTATTAAVENEENGEQSQNTQAIPTGIVWDGSGQFIAVIYDASLHVDFFAWKDGCVSHAARVECQQQPLGLARLSSSHVLVSIRGAPFVQEFVIDSPGQPRLLVTESKSPTLASLLEEVTKEITDMPESILERDEHGNLKIEKYSETRGPMHTKPWENVSRVETAKERNRRVRRKKRESMDDDNDHDDEDHESEQD